MTVPNPLYLWLLERDTVNRDEMHRCVVVAYGEDTARQAAALHARDERAGAWWMPTTTVTRIGTAAPELDIPGLVLADVFEG